MDWILYEESVMTPDPQEPEADFFSSQEEATHVSPEVPESTTFEKDVTIAEPNSAVLDKRRSLVWKEFLMIDMVECTDGKSRCICKHCQSSSFNANSRYGTGNMKRHLSKCTPYQNSLKNKGGATDDKGVHTEEVGSEPVESVSAVNECRSMIVHPFKDVNQDENTKDLKESNPTEEGNISKESEESDMGEDFKLVRLVPVSKQNSLLTKDALESQPTPKKRCRDVVEEDDDVKLAIRKPRTNKRLASQSIEESDVKPDVKPAVRRVRGSKVKEVVEVLNIEEE
uniref:BED-type domain-containing protein n=1 Tax=Chenopodium quinoa TaxID=63459 RepID=A0A803NC58_CHEQI